ncbi:MAG: cysteine--tRNA ligase [Candidatus Neomarinimicrobiota bacterium]
MGLRLYNTFARRKEDFEPLEGKNVGIYSCGPTVYDYSHIGNFRSFLFVDLLKRYLRLLGYNVEHVTNITDVDDRIITRCAEKGISRQELTQSFHEAFIDDSRTLGLLPASIYPRATDHIREMQEVTLALVEKGYAYATGDGSVFFKVSSFPDYGKLSGIDVTTLSHDRVLSDHYEKEDARDFSLWKGWKEKDGDVYWESPWGRGRPGWHLECSAMSMKCLGEEFDVHCGGVDLIFPHHENEIAQSVCSTGKRFANFWLHSEHLLVDGVRMSKSSGNYYTLRDLLHQGVSPPAIRYFLISTHYRQKMNLTFELLESAARSVERLQDFRRRLQAVARETGEKETGRHEDVMNGFCEAMNDDLNISEGMAVIFTCVREVNRRLEENDVEPREAQEILGVLRKLDSVVGIIFADEVELSRKDRDLIQEREGARARKDWKRADDIREYFLDNGIGLDDTPQGTVVKRVGQVEKE